MSAQIPLVTDLDDTLIRTDLVFESLFLFFKQSPLNLIVALWWLISGGRPKLKRNLANSVSLQYEALPYRSDVLALLKEEKAKGREIVLASASDEIYILGISEHLRIFDLVLGSDGKSNLKGENKRAELVRRYGEKGFDYIGDSKADLKVWPSAKNALVVSSDEEYINKVKSITNVSHIFPGRQKSQLPEVVKSCRVYQWVKNLLLVLPLLMAHKISVENLKDIFLAIMSFSASASAIYVLNDLLDLDGDRLHPTKRRRPFASGDLPLYYGFFLVPILIAIGLSLSLLLPLNFTYILILYLLITCLYSFKLKRLILLDIFTLATLYSIRIIAGGFAVSVPISQWLLIFSMFFFLSLAAVKRFSELYRARKGTLKKISGRAYSEEDLEVIGVFGSVTGVISALVLAVYVTSGDVVELYSHPKFLLLICPILLYWITRIWLIAYRGKLHDDPILFAITDLSSYYVGVISAIVVLISI